MSAAPLKRARWRGYCGVASGFPRSHERGPVEALGGFSDLRPPRDGFRAHMSAAPLKQGGAGDVSKPTVRFRAHMSAAPLKPIGDAYPDAHTISFRAHMSAAPLKQID